MRQLCNILAIFCFIYSASAKDILLPPNMKPTSLYPDTYVTEWKVKACKECKIAAICQFLTDSCTSANITLNTGDETLIKCPEDGKFLTVSHRNEMEITIKNYGSEVLAICTVKSTVPYIGKSEPPEPNSREYGLESKGKQKPTCRCGWSNKTPQRIVNGKHASLHEFPFIARIVIRHSRQGFCGGSIITKRHVLTASHCTVPYMQHSLSVVVGEHDVATTLETLETKVYHVERVINHNRYDPGNNINDISILLLQKEIVFNDVIGPVCLPEVQQDLLGQYIKVMGWGRTKDEKLGGTLPDILSHVNLLVVDPTICKAVFLTTPSIKRQICTFRNDKDSCTGDSGGPLVLRDPNTNMFKQVALVSYGLKCASTNPAVNTDVAYYMDWIKQVIIETAPSEICH